MKAILFVFLLLVCSCRFDRLIINTRSDAHIYNYFPLRTNYLEFSVKAKNDIHIILSNSYDKESAYYEIAIGAWSNSRSLIRKDSVDPRVEFRGAIIDPDEFQMFWVAINDTDESITVGKKYGKSFMYFRDPNYVRMSNFGISTGFGSGGIWNFDFDMFKCTNFDCF